MGALASIYLLTASKKTTFLHDLVGRVEACCKANTPFPHIQPQIMGSELDWADNPLGKQAPNGYTQARYNRITAVLAGYLESEV